jgi:hypothetical protein
MNLYMELSALRHSYKQCEILSIVTIVFSILCAVNYWSSIDLVETSLQIFVSNIISKREGQQYFAISIKDCHALQGNN